MQTIDIKKMKNKTILYIFFVVLFLFFSKSFIVQAQYFGKNKAQYKIFDWKYIESKHFDVYYNKGSKYLAEFSAQALEKALISIQNTLNFKLTQRIAVVVYDSHNDFQQTNVIDLYLNQGIGGVTELYKNRVVVPFQGDYSQLRHVLHHELVHAVINDMFYGGTIQTALTTTGVFFLPLWLNEGLAEWESLGGMNIETDMFMRDLTMSENLPSLDNIHGYLAYRAGQTFYDYVANKYGKAKITELLNKLKNYRNLDLAFENTFGLSLEDFSDVWQTNVRKNYWPDITVYKSPKEFATALTNHKKQQCFYFSSPAISPNGEKMAYISDLDGGIFAIFVSSTTPSEKDKEKKPKKIISSARQNDFEQLNVLTPGISWSPDGKKIVVSAKSGGEDAIFIVDVEKEDYEKIKPGFASITSVVWSPDGEKIAFVGIKNNQSDLFYYNLNDKKVYNITNDIFSDKAPTWAPDSKTLYYISDRGDNLTKDVTNDKMKIWNTNFEQCDIYNVDIESREIKRISYEPDVTKISLVVSSDNKKLLYVSTKNGIGNIYEYTIETKTERPITNSATGITQLSMTPDNLNLIFATQIEGGYDIFLLRNPFEQTIAETELPLTNFMKGNMEKINFLSEHEDIDIVDSKDTDVPITYGDFIVDFSSQQFLKPNTEVIQPIEHEHLSNPENNFLFYEQYIEKDYQVNFSLDALLINPGVSTFYGLQGNGAVMFSDIMGNHQIFLQAYLLTDLKNSQFYASYFYNTQIIDYSFSLYNYSAYVWNYLQDYNANYLYSYRNTGAVLGSKYAFDLFKRVELKLNLVNAAKENTEMPSYESISRFLLVPEFQFVLDNTLNGIYAPTRGTRFNFRALVSPKFTENSSDFITLTFDARQYIEIIPNFMSFALRGSGGASFGGRSQTFYMGGVNNWINSSFKSGNFSLQEPEDFAFMQNFLMPMRAYPVCELMGNKFFLTNIEYRFPIFMALMTGGIPLIIQGVMGNAFLDVGGTWTDDFKITQHDANGVRKPANLLMSAGWGLRAIILGLPVKFDMGWRNEFSGWSKPYYMVSLGLDF